MRRARNARFGRLALFGPPARVFSLGLAASPQELLFIIVLPSEVVRCARIVIQYKAFLHNPSKIQSHTPCPSEPQRHPIAVTFWMSQAPVCATWIVEPGKALSKAFDIRRIADCFNVRQSALLGPSSLAYHPEPDLEASGLGHRRFHCHQGALNFGRINLL